MIKRPLGNTDIEVSEIAFGGVEIGMPYGIGIGSEKDMIQEKEAIRLLHMALDSGINFFDTARMYGQSEAIMGKAFYSRREEIIICSKCRHFRDSQGGLPSSTAIERMIAESLEESLEALNTDYIDLYMLHQADKEILQHEDIVKVFERLKKAGVVRAIGVSTYTLEETDTAIESGVWEVIQLPFNLMDQRQSAMFSKARQKGVGVVIRSVLLKGLLSDRGKNLADPLSEIECHIQEYNELLNRHACDLPSLAIKFALSFEEVSAVLVGIDKEKYLRQALMAADGHYLDESSLMSARNLGFPKPEFIDLPYWNKMGWLT